MLKGQTPTCDCLPYHSEYTASPTAGTDKVLFKAWWEKQNDKYLDKHEKMGESLRDIYKMEAGRIGSHHLGGILRHSFSISKEESGSTMICTEWDYSNKISGWMVTNYALPVYINFFHKLLLIIELCKNPVEDLCFYNSYSTVTMATETVTWYMPDWQRFFPNTFQIANIFSSYTFSKHHTSYISKLSLTYSKYRVPCTHEAACQAQKAQIHPQ